MKRRVPCTACNSRISTPCNFLLLCICGTAWHHRCLEHPLPQSDLIMMIEAFNNGTFEGSVKAWRCTTCISMGRESKHYSPPPLADETIASFGKEAVQIISLIGEKKDNEKQKGEDVNVEMLKERVPAKGKLGSRSQPVASSSRSPAFPPSRRKNKTNRQRTEPGTDTEGEIPDDVIVVERRVNSRVSKVTRQLLKGTPIDSTPSNSPWPEPQPPAGSSGMIYKAAFSLNTRASNPVQTLASPDPRLPPQPPKCSVCSSCRKNVDPAKESTRTYSLEAMNHNHGVASTVDSVLHVATSRTTLSGKNGHEITSGLLVNNKSITDPQHLDPRHETLGQRFPTRVTQSRTLPSSHLPFMLPLIDLDEALNRKRKLRRRRAMSAPAMPDISRSRSPSIIEEPPPKKRRLNEEKGKRNKESAPKANTVTKSVVGGISEASRTESGLRRRSTRKPGQAMAPGLPSTTRDTPLHRGSLTTRSGSKHTDDSRPPSDTSRARILPSEQTSTFIYDPAISSHNLSSLPSVQERMDVPTLPLVVRGSPPPRKVPPSISGPIRHVPPVSSLNSSIGQSGQKSQRGSTSVAKLTAATSQRGQPAVTSDATISYVDTWKGKTRSALSKAKRDSDTPKSFSPTVTEGSISNSATTISASTTPFALANVHAGNNIRSSSVDDFRQEQQPNVSSGNARTPISKKRFRANGRKEPRILSPTAEALQTPPSDAALILPPLDRQDDLPQTSHALPSNEMSTLYCDTPLDMALPRYPPTAIIITPLSRDSAPVQNRAIAASSSDPALSLPTPRSLSPRQKSARSTLDKIAARLPIQPPPARSPKLAELPRLAKWFKTGEMKSTPNERPGRTKPRAKPFAGRSAGWSFVGSRGTS